MLRMTPGGTWRQQPVDRLVAAIRGESVDADCLLQQVHGRQTPRAKFSVAGRSLERRQIPRPVRAPEPNRLLSKTSADRRESESFGGSAPKARFRSPPLALAARTRERHPNATLTANPLGKAQIAIGRSLAAPPLPHHRTYGSVY